MLGSYGPLHWETAGEIVVLGITVAILYAGAAYLQSRLQLNRDRSSGEAHYISLAYALLLLNAGCTVLYMVALVFLGIYPVESGLWIFWQVFYLISIPMVFHVLPVITLIAWAWSLVGWTRFHYALRDVALAALLTLAWGVSAGSYFGMEYVFRL